VLGPGNHDHDDDMTRFYLATFDKYSKILNGMALVSVSMVKYASACALDFIIFPDLAPESARTWNFKAK
jgi:hypothetical protein